MNDPVGLQMADSERERRTDALAESFSLGRLTKEELDSRLATVLTARNTLEADEALTGLPSSLRPLTPGPHAPVARQLGWPMPARLQHPGHRHWGPWALTGLICVVVWLATSMAQGAPLSFWPGWVIGPWGLVLIVRQAANLWDRP